jgi:hypothetical protein
MSNESGTIAFGEAEVFDEAGMLAANGRVIYMILRSRTLTAKGAGIP